MAGDSKDKRMLVRLWSALFGPIDKWWSWAVAGAGLALVGWIVVGERLMSGLVFLSGLVAAAVGAAVRAKAQEKQSTKQNDG